jgi:hypothetical protein
MDNKSKKKKIRKNNTPVNSMTRDDLEKNILAGYFLARTFAFASASCTV